MVKAEKTTKMHKEHCLNLMNREKMELSGVCEVVSFSESAVLLKTVCGNLTIRGSSLNIGKLDTQTGELSVSGTVTLMRYDKPRNKDGLIEGLFK